MEFLIFVGIVVSCILLFVVFVVGMVSTDEMVGYAVSDVTYEPNQNHRKWVQIFFGSVSSILVFVVMTGHKTRPYIGKAWKFLVYKEEK